MIDGAKCIETSALVSITHGKPCQHIWTYAAAVSEVPTAHVPAAQELCLHILSGKQLVLRPCN